MSKKDAVFINKKTIFLWAVIITLLCLTAYLLKPFVFSLSLGVILAIALIGVKEKVEKVLHLNSTPAALIVCLVFTFMIMASVGIVGAKTIGYFRGNGHANSELQQFKREFLQLVNKVKEKINLPIGSKTFQSISEEIRISSKTFLTKLGKNLIANVSVIILQFVIMVLTIFTTLSNERKISLSLLRFYGVSLDRFNETKIIITNVCRDIVFANLITGFLQAFLVAVGAAVLTKVDPMLVFVLTFVLAFIPVIGASPVAGVLAMFEFIHQSYTVGFLLLALMLVVGVSDNIVRAWLMSKKSNNSQFLNFLACIGGIYVWGLSGLFLGPIVMSITLKMVPLLFKEVSSSPSGAKKNL